MKIVWQIWNDPLIHIPLKKRKNDRKRDKTKY